MELSDRGYERAGLRVRADGGGDVLYPRVVYDGLAGADAVQDELREHGGEADLDAH